MIKKLLFGLCLAIIPLGFFLIFAGGVHAADATNISISPLVFDLSANPGDNITNEILIRNSSSEPIVISAEAQDFVASGEEGEVNLTNNELTYSLSSWIQLDSGKFTLDGGQQKKVKFTIRIPFNAEPGGHYASVFAHIGPTLDNSTSGATVGQKIGSLILLKVSGNAKEAANVETFATTKNIFEKGPIDFNVRIKNDGTVHLKPKGLITITDIFGKKVADVVVDQKNVLPGSIRHMTASWSNPPAFGKFTATMLTYYGPDNQQLTSATTFWVIPWKTFLIWGSVILVALVVIWLSRGRIKSAVQAFIKHK